MYFCLSINTNHQTFIEMNTHKEKKTNSKQWHHVQLCMSTQKLVWLVWTSTELLPVVQFRNYHSSFTELRLWHWINLVLLITLCKNTDCEDIVWCFWTEKTILKVYIHFKGNVWYLQWDRLHCVEKHFNVIHTIQH